MPASLGTEEALIKLLIAKGEWAATKSYLGMTKLAAPTKKTTEKEYKENEVTEANGWKRKEVDTLVYEVATKAEGATGFTIIKNTEAVVLVSAAKEIKEELKLETFVIKLHSLQAEDTAVTTSVYLFGKLTIPVTVNEAVSKFEIPAKELIVECE